MPLNITDAESAWLNGITRTKDWQEKFDSAWSAPVVSTSNRMMAQQLAQLPEPVRMQLQMRNPQAWGAVEQILRGGK